MKDIAQFLAHELSLQVWQVEHALQLHREGGTVPFIARYRKEKTGEMNEVQLHELFDRHTYLLELEQRKHAVLKSIEEQGKLTDELRLKIAACVQKTELEDLYLPFRPKKRTRALLAKERGLEPLAEAIRAANTPASPPVILEELAVPFVDPGKGVPGAQDALAGASDILAEEVAEHAGHRAHLREYIHAEGVFASEIRKDRPEGSTKFEMYRSFRSRVKDIHPHNMLALLRGEKEGVLSFDIQFEPDNVFQYLESQEIRSTAEPLVAFLKAMLRDAFDRLLRPALVGEVRALRKAAADLASIQTFEANLRELLLSAPAGMKPTLAIDPGFRTGCKVVALDTTGRFVDHQTIQPHTSEPERVAAADTLVRMITEHRVELIAIGNGTASRETEHFVREVLARTETRPVCVIVNESGASVYSASHIAREEFPDLDVTIRGAVSIGRRLQDPLAELVKIDPKSIGVGQYQHDVDQKLLKKKLDETVESCVNYVGVDVNTASRELLKHVAGINVALAKGIIAYRNDRGPFRTREELKQIPKFGPKSFEQAAGFLRIRGGDNPLDNSAVHPESYPVAQRILGDLGMTLEDVTRNPASLHHVNLQPYMTDTIGEPTLRDILAELQKPGRDPRAEFKYATFREGVNEIKDLQPGMELEGVVTNVTNFGAFVDIGVHQDGLVHVSQVADRYVDDPKKVVHVGQIVRVRVLEVNEQLKRISLTMKSPAAAHPKKDRPRHGKKKPPQKHRTEPENPHYTLDDLKAKFNKR